MTKVLQLNTSIHSDTATSTQLANRFVATLPGAQVARRNLAADPLPHLDADRFAAFTTPVEKRTREQRQHASLSDLLIEEVKEADVVVIGLPMYNFGVPSQFKSWIDHIARAGITFKYTDKGPVGLLTGKKAIVFATRGGLYAGTPLDSQTAYVRDVLKFLGFASVDFIYAEGMAMGDASRIAAVEKAQAQIDGRALAPVAQAA